MKNIYTIVLSIIIGINTMAQATTERDEKAKVVLDKLSKEIKGYTSMVIDFKLSIKSSELNENQTGKAYTKGIKFFYTTSERDVYSNGESVWTYVKDDNECYIDDMDDVEGGINPNEIMTIWEKNFKYKHFGTKEGVTEIRLYPSNPKDSKYHTVILKINEAKNKINSINIKTKDAVEVRFTINKLTPNTNISETKFIWNKSKNPGVDEIDNR